MVFDRPAGEILQDLMLGIVGHGEAEWVLCTLTWSFAVLKPTELPLDSGVTLTFAVREDGRTANDASSGSCPADPTRTRRTSSRNAVICRMAVPERISIPLGSGVR